MTTLAFTRAVLTICEVFVLAEMLRSGRTWARFSPDIRRGTSPGIFWLAFASWVCVFGLVTGVMWSIRL